MKKVKEAKYNNDYQMIYNSQNNSNALYRLIPEPFLTNFYWGGQMMKRGPISGEC